MATSDKRNGSKKNNDSDNMGKTHPDSQQPVVAGSSDDGAEVSSTTDQTPGHNRNDVAGEATLATQEHTSTSEQSLHSDDKEAINPETELMSLGALMTRTARLGTAGMRDIFPYALMVSILLYVYYLFYLPLVLNTPNIEFGLIESLATLIWLLMLTFLLKPLILVTSYRMLNKPLSLKEIIHKTTQNLSDYFLVAGGYLIIFSLGMMFFILPGIYCYIAAWFALPLTALLNIDAASAIRASFSLVNNHWWRCFVAFFLVSVTFVLLGHGIYLVWPGAIAHHVIFTAFGIIITAFQLVYSTSLTMLLLQDLTARSTLYAQSELHYGADDQ